MATCVRCGLAGAPVGWDGLCPKCKRLADADATLNPFALNPFALPRMTRPWKTVVVAMAVFGFVYGYVGTAGSAPWACGSVGQCLQWTLDRGFPGFFYPAALGPGAYWALLFGAAAYVLFLTEFGIKKAFHWEPADRGEKQSALAEGLPLAASRSGETQSALTEGLPLAASGSGERQWPRPKALLLAVGVALAWGILSVGPSQFANDLYQLIPRDSVTAPSCTSDAPQVGSRCRHLREGVFITNPGDLYYYTDVACGYKPVEPVEPDGMCHKRSGGEPGFLVGDVLRGGQNALLAFLAIGAALLLWPRLRAAMLATSPGRAALRAPMLDIGTSDPPVGPGETVGDKLRQLAALRDDGIISSEEFEAKKVELLRAF